MKIRRYYHLVERESSDVSLAWKVFHIFILILIFVASVLSAYAFGELFDAFNYRCLLYAKPVFIIDQVHFFNGTVEANQTKEVTAAVIITKLGKVDDSDAWKPEIIFSYDKKADISARIIEDWTSAVKIPNTDYYVLNDVLYFKNGSLYGEVNIKMMRTVFATMLMCDYVLFVPFLSLVVASVFAGIFIFYGRGGRGYQGDHVPQGWRVVYFSLSLSTVLCLLFVVATNMANNGMKHFCARFSTFTGLTECNPYMNYFTYQTRLGYTRLYLHYIITHYTYIINTCLWGCQLVLTLLRMICMTDFQFYTVLVGIKRKTDRQMQVDLDDEPVWAKPTSPKLYSAYKQMRDKTNIKFDDEKKK